MIQDLEGYDFTGGVQDGEYGKAICWRCWVSSFTFFLFPGQFVKIRRKQSMSEPYGDMQGRMLDKRSGIRVLASTFAR